ncbi:MAG: DoxX family protein [Methylococcaceae bacterium]|nr:DoxX family protein [Methylococcaceae bacterium]
MKEPDESRFLSASNEPSCIACPVAAVLSPANLRAAFGWLSGWFDHLGDIIPPLLLRIILAYEFGEAGWEKLQGENWFADLTFPFPFSLLPPEANWLLATGFELLGAAALVAGLATRFFSLVLAVITLVAIAAVHWPSEWATFSDLLEGYAITDQGHGNYKLPLLYLAMLAPLLFGGAGRLSLDHWLAARMRKEDCCQPQTTVSGCKAGTCLENSD